MISTALDSGRRVCNVAAVVVAAAVTVAVYLIVGPDSNPRDPSMYCWYVLIDSRQIAVGWLRTTKYPTVALA